VRVRPWRESKGSERGTLGGYALFQTHNEQVVGRPKVHPGEAVGLSQVAVGRYCGLREGTILNSVEGGDREEKTSVERRYRGY
jgi:hypothetical protein